MNVIVWTDLDGDVVQVGDLFVVAEAYGEPRVRFRYDDDFVAAGYAIDPALKLDTAPHELRGLPLALEDASPDHWGQMLLQRAERMAAEEAGRASMKLGSEQFLLGASDLTRHGALRFQTEQDGPFLDGNVTVPRMLEMASLLEDAEEVAADPNTENLEAVERLLETGTSALGGARPKAAVVDDAGGLWLAKFPRVGDPNNVPVWEMVALDIAERGGMVVPERRLVAVGDQQVLLVRRFDRREDGSRVGYISARTLLGLRDLGADGDYVFRGIAPRLRQNSPDPRRDAQLLWRQAVLNLMINNTDNHLRNHGLLREDNGWALSPVFDLDPNPDTGSMFCTQYSGAVHRSSGLRNIMKMAHDIGISERTAKTILEEMLQALDGWDARADGYGAPDTEIALFHDAFTGAVPGVQNLISG